MTRRSWSLLGVIVVCIISEMVNYFGPNSMIRLKVAESVLAIASYALLVLWGTKHPNQRLPKRKQG